MPAISEWRVAVVRRETVGEPEPRMAQPRRRGRGNARTDTPAASSSGTGRNERFESPRTAPTARIGQRGLFLETLTDEDHQDMCVAAIAELDLTHASWESEQQERSYRLSMLAYHSRNVHPLLLQVKEQCDFCVQEVKRMSPLVAANDLVANDEAASRRAKSRTAEDLWTALSQTSQLVEDLATQLHGEKQRADSLERRVAEMEKAWSRGGEEYMRHVMASRDDANPIYVRIAHARSAAVIARNTPSASRATSRACSSAGSVPASRAASYAGSAVGSNADIGT